jgi:hypothetical protein
VGDGSLIVGGTATVVLGRSRVGGVEVAMPELDPPEPQEARATAVTTSTD